MPSLIFHSAYRPASVDVRRLAISTKFREVLEIFADLWPGEVVWLAEPRSDRELDMSEEIVTSELPVTVEFVDRNRLPTDILNRPDSVVLTALEGGLPDMPLVVGNAARRLVYYSDTPPTVAWDIAKLTTGNPARLARRWLQIQRNDRMYRSSLVRAAGLQCNQYPAYDHYGHLTPSSMVYIDTRVPEGKASSPQQMEARRQRYETGAPLHLCYSGRLISLKSPLDIADIATVLRDMGTPFVWSVFGDGDLKEELAMTIKQRRLHEQVTLRGFVDFETELFPALQNHIDLFVFTHRQGDSSCTYPETMAAGLPLIGYPNRALASLNIHCGVGTVTGDFTVQAIAEEITRFHHDRAKLWEAARVNREWAGDRTIEAAYQERVDHLLAIAA